MAVTKQCGGQSKTVKYLNRKIKFIGEETVSEKLAALLNQLEETGQNLETSEQIRLCYTQTIPAQMDGKPIHSYHSRRSEYYHTGEDAAKWMLIAGRPVEQVRGLYLKIAQTVLPCYEGWDFPLEEREVFTSSFKECEKIANSTMCPSSHKIIPSAEHEGQYQLTCTSRKAHFDLPRTREVVEYALLGGDEDLARKIIELRKGAIDFADCPDYWYEMVLFAILLGETDEAKRILSHEPGGYARGYAPRRREFLHGILEQDPALIVLGAKKAATTLSGQWSWSKHEKRYQNQVHRWKSSYPTLDILREELVRDLADGWVYDPFGCVCIGMAIRRGMTSLLQEKKLFSEWHPRGLGFIE